MITQNSIPEVKEDFIGYALHERRIRLPQFQDLGPADLVTLTKYLPTSSNTNAINSTSRNGAAIIQSPAAVVADDSAASMATNGDASDTAVTTNYTNASIYSSSRNANDGAPMVAELHPLDKLKDEVGTFFLLNGCRYIRSNFNRNFFERDFRGHQRETPSLVWQEENLQCCSNFIFHLECVQEMRHKCRRSYSRIDSELYSGLQR